MLKNYIKIAIRNLIKNKSYSAINIAGLSLGIVCAMLIFMIIRFDLSFDTYHQNAGNTYRLVYEQNRFGETSFGEGVPYPLPEALRVEFPGIEYLSVVDNNNTPSVIAVETPTGRQKFNIGNLPGEYGAVRQDYFNIFDLNWLHGNPQTALNRPGTIVLSKPVADILFGNQNPLGKTIVLDGSREMEITGIVGKIPENTDLPFSMMAYFEIPEWAVDNWGSVSSSTQVYFTLKPGTQPATIEAGLPGFVDKYGLEEPDEELSYSLQPLGEIHFGNKYGNFSHRVVTSAGLWALGLIGLFLLVTACINFINLNTAVAVQRSKEVGVRKVLGGTRLQLIAYFLVETAVITLIAILCSLLFVELSSGFVESFLGYELALSKLAGDLFIFLTLLLIAVTFTAGLYPAFVLSGYGPTEAIRNTIRASYGRGASLRKGLVVFQFAISQVLIISMIVMWNQMDYFTQVDMGFNKEAVVEVPVHEPDETTREQFRQQLMQQASILEITYSNTGTASQNVWSSGYELYSDDQIQEGQTQIKFVDEHFTKTYELEIVAGENLRPTGSDSVTQFLVNEAFAKSSGFGEEYHRLLGKEIALWSYRAPITGIVKNFNTQSLHAPIQPVVMVVDDRYSISGIRINTANTSQALQQIEEAWTAAFPQYVFEYQFLDDVVREFYEDEQKGVQLVNAFTVIAIIIGCLGLFGLISYMASTRTKEIGIRKVLGAATSDIIQIFSKEITLLILVAFILAAPLAYFLMSSWLTDFAYKIDLSAWFFIVSLLATLGLAVLTVGYRSLKAAFANPVESLQSE
ncbi:ABC transporter permease [Aliifodinibius sp. S!AR15-10]|uniref:ABC transporter permease n=1 Tax=Aliifodinibius sp. S!AR15-10 TaxID=2950437 RepID=UPI0028550F3D|nr:ABC transporter permease [Aliifodinibius sp. S!AR15-10]MDR8393695.1 ABC transporter permease [Aliifodinibius sp. S!AR15-10]